MSLTKREQFREHMLKSVPNWYVPWVHLATTAGLSSLAVAVAGSQLSSVSAIELLTIPAVFLLSNLLEWHAHKHLLHKRVWPMQVLYDRHTPEHHRVYRYHSMEIREWKELRLVLIPAVGVLGIIATSVPGALLAGWIFGSNVGWLFLLTSAAYVASYELTHFAYHLRKDSFIGRLGFVRWMREHHAIHHDPRLMQRYNFNVTVPLGDLLFGTMASKDLVEMVKKPSTQEEPWPESDSDLSPQTQATERTSEA